MNTEYVYYKEELTDQDKWAIIYGDREDFIVVSDTIEEQSRWQTLHIVLLQHKETLKYYEGWYQVGSTEQQEGSEAVCDKFQEVRLIAEITYSTSPVKA